MQDLTPIPAVEPGALAFIAPQGHGTMVESHAGATALAGAGVRVIFPNVANHPPGTKLRFWSYDAQTFGEQTKRTSKCDPAQTHVSSPIRAFGNQGS